MKKFFSLLSLLVCISIGQVWATDYYVKVTSAPSDWAGDYLIVYESGNVAFDGSLSTLDAVGNTKAVTINNGKIEATAEMNAIKFTISADASESGWYQLKSASGYYIAGTQKSSNAGNGLKSTNTENIKSNYINQPGVGQILSKSADQNMTLRYNSASNQTRFRYYKSGQQAIALYKFEAGTTTACATPTFTPAAGAVLSGTTVAISCTTDGATIHYTTDGTTPTESSPTYSSAITINAAKTIKAIAVKSGLSNSSVASASYTIATPLTTMQAIFDAATSTATTTYITFSDSWVVTGVASNGKTAYLTDGTKGLILYNSSTSMGLAVGNTLSGTVATSLVLFNGAAELQNFTTTGLTKGNASVPAVQELDAAGIEALSGVKTGSLIKISGAATSASEVAGLTLYKTIYPESSLPSLTTGHNYDVTGVYVQYNSTKEILPRSAADIVENVVTHTVTYNNAPSNGTLTIKNGNDVVASGSAVNEGTVLTIVTSPAEGYKLAGVTVNGIAYAESTLTLSEDVTIAATFEVNQAPLVTTYILSEIGVETSHLNGERVGDKVNLPSTATTCSKTFVGWSANASCAVAPEYAPGAEYTLAANNKLYAVYADAHVVTPTDHALGSATFNGTNEGGNTASTGYTFSKSTKGDNKAGYIQDSGTKDADIIYLQIKAASQIINEEPSAIIVTAHLGAGANRDELTYPVNAVLVDADGANVGDPVVLTNSIPDKNGDDFSVELPTANYANVRGVKISHMKEDGWNVRYYSMSFKYQTGGTTYDNYSIECAAAPATLVSIAISGTATELEYTEGDEFDPAGLVVTGTYSDDTEEEITEGITWAFDPETLSTSDESVSVTATVSEITSEAFVVNGLTVNSSTPALTDYYEKVTTTAGITEGTYLIVYEEGNVAFNGGLETLDAESNTIAVEITNDKKIGVTEQTAAATFYIDPTAGTIKSASNHYIGVSSWSNGLKQTETYVHNVLEIDGDENAQVGIYNASWNTTGGTMRLQYNKSTGQTRFRYYKNGGQQPIALYKLHGETIKASPELAWSGDVEMTVGGEFTSPTLSHAAGITGTITYSSDKEAVATVDANGVISLVADATGTAKITASYPGDANFKDGSAVCTIKVNPAHSIYVSPSLTVNFGSIAQNATVEDKVITVTLTAVDAATAVLSGDGASAFSFTPDALTASGDITISASTATIGTFEAKLTISDDAGLATSRVVTLKLAVTDPDAEETPISTSTKWVPATEISDGMQVLVTGVKDEVVYAMGEQKSTNRAAYAGTLDGDVFTPGEGTMAFTLVAQGDGTYAIRTSNGKYLYAAKNDANHLKTQDEVDVNAKWTISTTSAEARGSSNRNIMRFNGSGDNKLFSCYSSGQTEIKFYVPQPIEPEEPVLNFVELRSGLNVNSYYTVCMDKNILAVRGATFWSLNNRAADGSEVYFEEATAPYEAGKPYIFYTSSSTVEVAYGGETAVSPVANGALRGTFDPMDQDAINAASTANGGSDIYIVSSNQLWQVAGRSNNSLGANRAYIVYNDLVNGEPAPVAGRRVIRMPMQGNTATGIDGLNVGTAETKKVILNGQFFIIREGKTYDVTGCVVK